MRKAGAKEGSTGSKGAIDGNRSHVSVAVTGRRSDLMIKFGNCTVQSSSSSLANLNSTGASMTCKGCSGESTSGKGGPSCSNTLNSMGLELPRPIDLEVRWKNVNKRQRATRRARTSFFGEDRMKDDLRSFYAFGNAMTREVSSDSEKLGVSILGRRFSDSMGNVPIKKRRFRMDCSPSPPPTPVLVVDPYEKLLRSCSGGIPSYEKHCKVKILEDECKEEHRGLYGADDFSGILILAAAACDSEMGGEILNGACSKLAHPLEEMKLENTMGSTESHVEERKLENTMGGTSSYRPLEDRELVNTMSSAELSLLHGTEEDKLKVLEASHYTYDRPFESSNSAPDIKPLIANIGESASAPKDNFSLYPALSSADKTEVASDAKSSSVAVLSNSGNLDKSVGCLQDAAAQSKYTNATRDSRLHWDLNVAMDAWDTDCGCDDDDRSGPTVAPVGDSIDAEHDMNRTQVPHVHDSINADDAPRLSADQIHIVGMPKDVNTADEGHSLADALSHPLQHQSPQNMKILKPESVAKDTSAKTLNLPDQQNSMFASAVESILGSNPDPAVISEHFTSPSYVEKNDGSHPIPDACKGLSHMSSVNGYVGVNSIQTSELDSTGKPLASRLSEESTNFPTVTASHKRIIDVGWSDNKLEEASEQSISELKNQDLLDDSGTSKMHQLASKKGEHGTDVLYVTKSSADTENLTHPEENLGSSVCDMAHVHEEDGADAIMNSRDCLITCASSSSAETYYISSVIQAPALSSECNKPVVTDGGSIVDSQAATRSYQNTYKNELRKVASDICFEHCYGTDASHYSKTVAGTGKVDVEEDDSQYEDGEVRESGDWTNDVYESQCGNWHYQTSDYKNEVIIHDMPPLPIDSASKNLGIHVAGYNATETRKEHVTVPPTLSKRSWSTNCLDGGSGASGKAKHNYSRVPGENEMHDINPGRVNVGSAVTISGIERCNDGLGDNLSSIRTKNTGWDMFPEDQTRSRRSKDRADSSNRHLSSSIDAAGVDDSLRKVGLSNRDVQRIERPRSFDIAHRNELSRSDDGYASGTKAERAIDSCRSGGGYDALCHIQAVGSQGDQWAENSKHSRSTRHKSPECYNYGSAGPRNAAEAAVAKMESNGFVVARDGTLVRAVDAANAGQMARQMRNALSSSYHPLSGRGSPIDRDGTCGVSRGPAHAIEASPERHLGVTSNWSGRYGPEMEKDHTLGSVRCSLPSRQRGIPTGRASLNLSHAQSRSPSGSRSRSPHNWASPRNRRKIMSNGGSTLQRPSRSPNRMSKDRIGRMASPQRQPLYDDRAMRYSPPPRNRNYSHPSTWVDGRNSSTVALSDHNKRDSRRSPLKITSRNDRFDVISQERSRAGEFYRPTQGRLTYGYDRGNKHDGNGDDRREYTDRYQSHSAKPYNRDGALKQFRSNSGDKFRTRISAHRSPELQRRASPRRFDRNFER